MKNYIGNIEMCNVINYEYNIIKELLIIGNDNTVDKLDYFRLKDEIVTVSVNRIWMTYMPNIMYVIDPEIFKEIEIKIKNKEIEYQDFNNTIIFYNFYLNLNSEFKNLLENLKSYPVNIGRNNSVIAIIKWFFQNYDNINFYIYGISLTYNKDKNHFWKGDNIVLNKRTKDWEIDKYDKNAAAFIELKKKGYNMISVMKESRLNSILEVIDIGHLFKKFNKKVLIVRPKNSIFNTFCEAIKETILEITNSETKIVIWNNKNLVNLVSLYDIILIVQIGILKKIQNKFINKEIVIYNTEPLKLKSNKYLLDLLKKFNNNLILEYSSKNMELLDNLNCNKKILFPIGYFKYYDSFYNKYSKKKDIDFLFFGNLTKRRIRILEILEDLGYVIRYYDNLFDTNKKIEMINRSKICLDIFRTINNNNNLHRITELICHRSFIIAELGDDFIINDKLNNIIIQTKYNNFIEICMKNIQKSDKELTNFSDNGYKLFKRRFSMIEKFSKII
jgi:hypothetical protein